MSTPGLHRAATGSGSWVSVQVEPGGVKPAPACPVLIGSGLLEQASRVLADSGCGARSCVVLADAALADTHLPRLRAGLAGMDIRGEWQVPGGEASKSMEQVAHLADRICRAGIDRQTVLVTLGGGVIGDLGGFLAAIVLRGLACVHCPTTLLAQVDSAVGGKTGVNLPAGKNLAGCFHHPVCVLADLDTLGTLPARQLRAGYAEIVKYALIRDAEFFGVLESCADRILEGEPAALQTAVERAVAGKAEIVALDAREQGPRALLNLGHTFGHAIEFAQHDHTDDPEALLLHGEAVAVGIDLAFCFSVHLGLCPASAARTVQEHLQRAGFCAHTRTDPPGTPEEEPACVRPVLWPRWLAEDPACLLPWMLRDKKMRNGQLVLVLAHGIGRAFVSDPLAPDTLAGWLASAGGRNRQAKDADHGSGLAGHIRDRGTA